MAEHCKTCGLELFAAQRFCRSCGAPTEQLSEEQVPTRMMPPPPEGWGARSGASTAPTSRQETSPVYDPSVGYQPAVPPMYPSVVPPYSPPGKRSPVGWILAFIGMGLFVLVVIAVMMMARFGRRMADQPSGRSVASARAGETALVEANAEKVDRAGADITLTKSFALSEAPTISVKNVSGSINISVWDKQEAEVKVTRRGSEGERNFTPVFFSNDGGNLVVRTADRRGSSDVRYELKLPRDVASLDLSSVNGAIKLSDIEGEITVQNVSGQTDLTNVAGLSKAGSVSGNINIVLKEWRNERLALNAVSGNISLQIKSAVDADLEASSVNGSISLDDSFGIAVEKQMVGQRARGKMGDGGETLKITTVSGNIKVSK
jgi:hypothetical protein